MKMLQWCIIEEDDLAIIMGYSGNIMQTFVFPLGLYPFPSLIPIHLNIYRQIKSIYICKQFAGGLLYRLLAYKLHEVDWSNSYGMECKCETIKINNNVIAVKLS